MSAFSDEETGSAQPLEYRKEKSSISKAEEKKPEDSKPLTEVDLNPDRHCTDLMCFLIFVAAIFALISLHIACFTQPNPWKLLHPLDHAGNSCGVGKMKDWPLVYFPSKKIIKGGPLVQDTYYNNPENRWSVCTSECPIHQSRVDRPWKCNEPSNAINGSETGATCTWYSEAATTEILGRYCIVGLDSTSYYDKTGVVCSSVQQAVADIHAEATQSFTDLSNLTTDDLQTLKQKVPAQHQWIIDSIEKSIENDIAKYHETLNEVTTMANNGTIQQVCADQIAEQQGTWYSFVEDILNAKDVLLLSAFWCIFLGLTLSILIARVVKWIIYTSIFVAIVGFSVCGYVFWTQSVKVTDTGLAEEGFEEKVLAVICWACAILLTVVFVIFRSRLQLAIAICQATSGFFGKNMGIYLLPCVLALLEIGFIVYMMAALCAILSTAEVKEAHNLTHEVQRFKIDTFIVGATLYHIFVGLWIHFCFEGLSVLTTAITVTEWYFSPKKKMSARRNSQFSVFVCLFEAVMYHLGTVAMGAFILPSIVIVQAVIRIFLWGSNKIGADGKVVRCCIGCITCCTSILTGFVKFVNVNAFIMTGIQSRGFISSAIASFGLLARNPARFLIFKGTMWTVDIAYRFVLMFMTIGFGALLLDKEVAPSLSKGVKSPWPPLLCIAILGYFIAGLFASSYTSVASSLFFNFVVDEEIARNTGRSSAQYAPKGLQGLLDEQSKKFNQNVEKTKTSKEEKEG